MPVIYVMPVIYIHVYACEVTISDLNNFSIFKVLTKFKHSVTQKGWEFFLI